MIKRLAPYFKGYGKYALLAPLLVMLETVCELLMPLQMARIIDVGIPNMDMKVILTAGALMFLLAVVAMITGSYSSKAASYAAQGMGANLRRAQFDKIASFSFADIDRFSSASLITRLTNDLTNLQNTAVMCLRMIIRALTMVVAALILAFTLSPRLALIVCVVLPILAVCVGVLMYVCHSLFEKMQKAIDDMNEKVQENLVAIRVVKSYVRENYERKKFQAANDNFTRTGLNAVLRVVLMQPIMMIGISVTTVLVLYNGANIVLAGGMGVGDLQTIINYIFQILFSILMVAMALLQYVRAQASAERVFEVLDTESDIEDGPAVTAEAAALLPADQRARAELIPAPQGSVEFRNASFKYLATGTGEDVLKNISFDVKPGEFTAIVGGTGTGKSSLVNLIPRFYDVTGGEVLVDGMDVRDYPLEALRRRIGMVLQNNVLFSGTIRENLLWGVPEETQADRDEMARRSISWDELVEERMIQAAKDAQAYDFIMSFPDGFDTYLEQGGVNVSGGQKQRLCIARAMLKHPAILILDDSTSAVDSTTEGLIRESFSRNLKGTTVIIIAQRISSVQYADKIVVLDNGTVAGVGNHDELMKTNGIYQEIYASQQEGVQE